MNNKEIVTAWFSNIDKGNFDNLRNQMAGKHSFRNPMAIMAQIAPSNA